jgi:hypothetical protein
MASTIGKVRAVFTASTSGLTAGVNQASSSFKKLESDVKGLRSGLSTLTAISGAQLFGSIASGASQAIRSLIGMGAAEAEVIDSTNLLAQRLGLTYAELAGLSNAGALVGVGMDTIGAAVTKAEVAFARAAGGSQTATAAFANLGLSVEQLNGMTAAERFQAIAQAISEIPSEAGRSAAAVQLFGRSGAQLMPIFAGGAAGIQAATAEAQRFGLGLSQLQADNVDAMGDSFDRAQQAISGVIQQVVAYLAPAIESVSSQFSDLIGSVGGATIGQTIGEGILTGARFLAQIGDALIANLSSVWSYVSQVGGQWSAVFEVGSRVGSVFAGIGRFLQGAFLTLVGVFSSIGEAILTGVRGAAEALGFDTTGLDTALAALRGFNEQLDEDIFSSFDAAGENLSAGLFGDDTKANSLGEAIAGPLTTAIDTSISAARDAAAQVDQAVSKPVEVKQNVSANTAAVTAALKGVDSRSREGVAEMFRLMRGEGGGVQERIATATERSADALEGLDLGLDVESFDLAPAAGV